MTEYQIRLIIALSAFLIGIFVGYTLWHKSKDSKTLTALQIVSVFVFFGYLGISYVTNQYSDLVAVSILALTGGEPIGKAIAKFAENYTKEKK